MMENVCSAGLCGQAEKGFTISSPGISRHVRWNTTAVANKSYIFHTQISPDVHPSCKMDLRARWIYEYDVVMSYS